MRRLALLALLVVAVVGGAAGCQRPAPLRLVLGTTSEPDTLVPMLTTSATAHEVHALFWRELTLRDPAWQLQPDLAERVPSLENGDARLEGERLIVHWRLRADARWDDGAPVVADDFALALLVQQDGTQEVVGRDDATRVERLLPDADGRGFTVTWREPNPFFAEPRVHRALPAHLLRARLVDEAGRVRALARDPFAQAPVGNGPFHLVEHAPGQFLRFARNQHATPRPLLDEVVVRVLPSAAALTAALEAGELDATVGAGGLPLDAALALVERAPARFAAARATGAQWAHLELNLDDPWLKDLRVRRALALAIPRARIVEATSKGAALVAESYFPPQHWAHAALPPLPHDPVAARALLDEAGLRAGPDGLRVDATGVRVSLVLSSSSESADVEQTLLLVQRALAEVGIHSRLELAPFKVFFGEGVRKRKFPHLAYLAWTVDPSTIGTQLWREDRIPSADNGFKGQNTTGYRNPEVTALLAEADRTLDVDERKRQLARVQQLLREELPAIPMAFKPVVVVHRIGVRGLQPTGGAAPLAWNAATWSVAPRTIGQ
ncbi:MAG: peptide ABC transporter substrate-binding protein [Deltaproteobacteria bacterium]|nr:peptide ABC transporter substrate-binding protein [Deltaproteobacteria bacterium]